VGVSGGVSGAESVGTWSFFGGNPETPQSLHKKKSILFLSIYSSSSVHEGLIGVYPLGLVGVYEGLVGVYGGIYGLY
jgi:hypothetical protein